jgi:hypothetical protein
MVSAGFTPPLVGKKEASTTYKFDKPWARFHGSRTLVSASMHHPSPPNPLHSRDRLEGDDDALDE